MSFNLKKYAEAKKSSPVTEKQLRDGGVAVAPQQTHERQLDSLRTTTPNNLTERQLASRQTDKAPTTLSEKQLVPQRAEAPNQTHERQLDAVRTDKSPEALIEATMRAEALAEGRIVTAEDVFKKHQRRIALDTLKLSDIGARLMGGMDKPEAINFLRSIGYSDLQLTKLLSASTHSPQEISALLGTQPNTPQTRTAAANLSDDHTERRLRGESTVEAPDSIHEDQLKKLRTDKSLPLAEKYLDKNRTDDVTTTIEGRLNKSKGGFHKHRNSDTSKGDLNQLEAQRVADKKRQEKEKVEPASETPKELRFYEETPGKDGIRLAQTVDFPIVDDVEASEGNEGGETDQDLLERLHEQNQLLESYRRQLLRTRRQDRSLLEDETPATGEQGLSHAELLARVKQQEQDLKAYERREFSAPSAVFDDITDLEVDEDEDEEGEDFEVREQRKPFVVPKNPAGPAVMRAFEVDDVLIGANEETGTPVEERALLYDKKKLAHLSDEQISDQALRYLQNKYPQANLTADNLMHLDGEGGVGQIQYTLVGQPSA